MEPWQIIVTAAAGIITILTLFEKIGKIIKDAKRADDSMDEVRKLPKKIEEINRQLQDSSNSQALMAEALKGIIRNELYMCFKEHRDIGACTDDEFRVQTALHETYKRLGGNGEEAVWWEKKTRWRIVSEEEFERLYLEYLEKQCPD
jgi:biopolymer transport protein ExbB/TolQ